MRLTKKQAQKYKNQYINDLMTIPGGEVEDVQVVGREDDWGICVFARKYIKPSQLEVIVGSNISIELELLT